MLRLIDISKVLHDFGNNFIGIGFFCDCFFLAAFVNLECLESSAIFNHLIVNFLFGKDPLFDLFTLAVTGCQIKY